MTYPPGAICNVCKQRGITTLVVFKGNVSFFFRRWEREFSGYVCFRCMSARFVEFELGTLFGTWWGIIGCILGPVFLLQNILEYAAGSYLIGRDFIKSRTKRPTITSLSTQRDSNNRKAESVLNAPVVRSAEALIDLFKAADASTLIHSEGRRWLSELLTDATHERAPEVLKAEAAAIREYVGATRESELATAQYRKFLLRFEIYLLENTAPNAELGRAFLRYRDWLETAYDTLKGSTIPINPNIEDWYERILSRSHQHDPIITPDRRIPGVP